MGYELVWEPHGLIKRLVGNVGTDDLLKMISAVHGDGRFDDLRYIIIDTRDSTGHSVPEPTLIEIAAVDEVAISTHYRFNGIQAKIAIVATDPVMISLAEAYTHFDSSGLAQIETFSTMDDARAWTYSPQA